MEGLTREKAGKRMRVFRGTVQRLATSGRFKIASALAGGKALITESLQNGEKSWGFGSRNREFRGSLAYLYRILDPPSSTLFTGVPTCRYTP